MSTKFESNGGKTVTGQKSGSELRRAGERPGKGGNEAWMVVEETYSDWQQY